ncbi:MAG: hypothetical protein ACTSWL_03305 [Promethearchaeota archaeon]
MKKIWTFLDIGIFLSLNQLSYLIHVSIGTAARSFSGMSKFVH